MNSWNFPPRSAGIHIHARLRQLCGSGQNLVETTLSVGAKRIRQSGCRGGGVAGDAMVVAVIALLVLLVVVAVVGSFCELHNSHCS